jgi:hypothetical protein
LFGLTGLVAGGGTKGDGGGSDACGNPTSGSSGFGLSEPSSDGKLVAIATASRMPAAIFATESQRI